MPPRARRAACGPWSVPTRPAVGSPGAARHPEALRPDARRAQALAPLGSPDRWRSAPHADLCGLIVDGEANGAGVELGAAGRLALGPRRRDGRHRGRRIQRQWPRLLAPGGSTSRAAAPGSGRVVVKATSEGLASSAPRWRAISRCTSADGWSPGRPAERATGDSMRAGDGARFALHGTSTSAARGLPVTGSLTISAGRNTLALDRLARTSPAATSKDSSRSPPPATGAGSRRALDEALAKCVARPAGGGCRRRDRGLGPPGRSLRCLRPRWLRGQRLAHRQALRAGRGHELEPPASTSPAAGGGEAVEGTCLGGRCSATQPSARRRPADISGSLRSSGRALKSLIGSAAGKAPQRSTAAR